MHFSLMVIGAHDGSKIEKYIRQQAELGNVLLVEPVPFLFERLKERFADCPSVRCRPCVVSTKDGEVEFTAPKPSASSVIVWADQLGSLRPGHAVSHRAAMSEHIDIIKMQAVSLATLVNDEDISSLDALVIDTEGMDAELLPTFPFSKVVPQGIVFEFKHSDGVMTVGRKLANLLLRLDELGYRTKVLDTENMIALQPGA